MRISDWSSDVCSSDHDVLVEELVRGELGFSRVKPNETDRPYYDPSVLLKLYVYGYLNRVLSGHPLEREAGRNADVMWLMADQLLSVRPADDRRPIGRASCRERVCQYVKISLGAESLKKKKQKN